MTRERVADVAVVVAAALLGMSGTVTPPPAFPKPYDLVAFALLSVAGAAALWFRRRAPVAVAWFVTVLTAILVLAVWWWPGIAPGTRLEPETTLVPAAAPFAAYSVAAHGDRARRSRWLPLVVTAVIACVGAPPSSVLVATIGLVVTLIGGPAVLGRHIAARAERAERVRRAERLRLAAEIHDVVSHRVSVMVLQAGALQLTAADEPVRQAAAELRATGCQALDELRDLVGLLNAAEPADRGLAEPLPDLSDLTSDVEVAGEACLLPPAIGRTAYRVVQEALTNAGKHAPGAHVRVEVRYLADSVRVSVHNTAPTRAADAELANAGGGTGLLGLRRRVELVGGTFHAQRKAAGGGFEVTATLPSGALP